MSATFADFGGNMEFCITAGELRKALTEIEQAEKIGRLVI